MSTLPLKGHWFGLSAACLVSLAGAYFVYDQQTDLPQKLQKFVPPPAASKAIPETDLSRMHNASKLITSPATWALDYATPLFASEHYLLEEGKPKKPAEGYLYYHSKTRQPIPNSWFLANKLNLYNPRIATEDSDGDGFTNEEEWAAKTDPVDPKSRPLLVTKLLFSTQKVANNRIRFLQYLGYNPTKPEGTRIFIRCEDSQGTPQHDLKVGEPIPGTDLVLSKFEYRTKRISGAPFDASIAIFTQKSTGRTEKAEIHEMANFTDTTIFLKLTHAQINREFSAKIGEKIALEEESYELVEASATSATLRSPAGKDFLITAAQP
ncbi:MAG: hypothetical protein RLZZ142_1631 [Verrucomicrobiota bacterium]|jgi:hypothetical protein